MVFGGKGAIVSIAPMDIPSTTLHPPSLAETVDRIIAARFNVLLADDSSSDLFLTARFIRKSRCLKVVAAVESGAAVKDYLLGHGKYSDARNSRFRICCCSTWTLES